MAVNIFWMRFSFNLSMSLINYSRLGPFVFFYCVFNYLLMLSKFKFFSFTFTLSLFLWAYGHFRQTVEYIYILENFVINQYNVIDFISRLSIGTLPGPSLLVLLFKETVHGKWIALFETHQSLTSVVFGTISIVAYSVFILV